jgi:3-dehydroquinate synthetase
MSDSSCSAEAGATASLQSFNRTIIGTEIIFSFPIGPSLVCDILSSLPSPIYAVITDDVVHELYGRVLVQAFLDQGARAVVYVLPNGEAHKSRHSKELIEDWMASACAFVRCKIVTFLQVGCGCTRRTVVVALGGGVVGDLAGFVASTCSPYP